MGMDGLSFANAGAVGEATSAEMTNKTEQAIQAGVANNSKQVQTLSNNQKVRAKDEEDSAKKQHKDNDENFEDGLVEKTEDDNLESEDFEVEDIENPNKDFYVQLNVKDDIIELYDSATNKLIETISGNELGELVNKLNMASGIFVNKRV